MSTKRRRHYHRKSTALEPAEKEEVAEMEVEDETTIGTTKAAAAADIDNGDVMRITDLSYDCLRDVVFKQMSLEQQLNTASQVCKSWYNVVQFGICRTKKSLTLALYRDEKVMTENWIHYYLNPDYDYFRSTGLHFTLPELTSGRIASLAKLFPSVTELTVLACCVDSGLEAKLVILLTQYKRQLVTFNLESVDSFFHIYVSERNVGDAADRPVPSARLFSTINSSMPELKHLKLNYYENRVWFKLFNVDSILARLDTFEFTCPSMSISILDRWMPVLESRAAAGGGGSSGGGGGLLKIGLDIGRRDHLYGADLEHFVSLPSPQVAAMFTSIPTLNCNTTILQRLSVLYSNLTHITVNDFEVAADHFPFMSSIPTVLQALSTLKQLTHLTISTEVPPVIDDDFADDERQRPLLAPHHHNAPSLDAVYPPPPPPPPQLMSLQKWTLDIWNRLPPEQVDHYSHGYLSKWMEQLAYMCPNLEELSVSLASFKRCSDCLSFDATLFGIANVENELWAAIAEERNRYKEVDAANFEQVEEDDNEIIETLFIRIAAKAKNCLLHQMGHIIKRQALQMPKLESANIYWKNMFRRPGYSHREKLYTYCTLDDVEVWPDGAVNANVGAVDVDGGGDHVN